jgi:hypothetical protein
VAGRRRGFPAPVPARVDGRADQYALAAAAFELLAGVVPFERVQVGLV